MSVVKKMQWLFVFSLMFSVVGGAFADNSYDRELIVTGDANRSDQVEVVFKELMAAYEDEDARGFLDLVSDDRFRQDYITFTDALYSDFRHYEIHHIDYWIDRVVPDHVKRFLYVRWEKRYENLDDGEQLTMTGYSRFLFDDVDGDYLLVELAGNSLFGDSLPEWVEELAPISGQELQISDVTTPDVVIKPGDVCDASHLSLCDGANCSSNGGYWYDGSCHNVPQPKADLVITTAYQDWLSVEYIVGFTVRNIGSEESSTCTLEAFPDSTKHTSEFVTIAPLSPGESRNYTEGFSEERSRLEIDSNNVVDELNEYNNTYNL